MPTIYKIRSAMLLCILPVLMACFLPEARAADPTITATLSSDSASVGEAVELSLKINGARNAQAPEKIDVTGLSVEHSGQQTQFQMQNFNVSSSVVHTYTIVPAQKGKFTIPAITVEVDGKKLTSQPLTLTVTGNSGGSSGTSGGNATSSGTAGANDKPEVNEKIAFSELIVPKQEAYVGEVIPIEIRIYFDSNVRVQTSGMPTVTAEGFTVQKLTEPQQKQIEKNGHRYNFVSFKTAITPVKSGRLTLGPAELAYVAIIPQRRKAPRPRMNGNIDDFFNDDMFGMLGGGYVQQNFTVKSNDTSLEVKPLPKAGQPKDFSGAVGQFSLSTEASPLKLNLGDPVILKLKISGRGNFDIMSAPHLAEAGWRSYPPSGKFTADDDVGISGSKAFEMAVIPEEKKTKLPLVEFSYFDPLTEKYVTLNADRLPIVVEGQATPTPVAAAQTSSSSQPESTPATANNPADIHYILTGPAHWDASFQPVFKQPVFWKSQGIPLVAFLAFIGFQVMRRRSQNAMARQLAELRRQKNELMKILQREDTDAVTFYDAAARYLQVEAASRSNRNPSSIASAEIITMRNLDAATGEAVQSIFAAHEEFQYAGEKATRQKVSPAQRQAALEAIKKFEDAQA